MKCRGNRGREGDRQQQTVRLTLQKVRTEVGRWGSQRAGRRGRVGGQRVKVAGELGRTGRKEPRLLPLGVWSDGAW